MFIFKRFGKSKGQALVEAALTAPLIVFFLFTVIWFAGIMLTWQQITGAAKYGTDLIAYTDFSQQSIENNIRNYLCDRNTIGRKLNPDRNVLNIRVDINDQPRMDYRISIFNTESYNPLNVLEQIGGIAMPFIENSSSVVITYEYRMPAVFRSLSRRETLKITARSEVLTGFGSAGQKRRRG